MADEVVGSAYVIIRAITNKIRDDIRDGVKKGAGDPALESAGEDIGDTVGKAAGRRASETMHDEIEEGVSRDPSALRRAGQNIGDIIGRETGDRIHRDIVNGVRDIQRDRNVFQRIGRRIASSIVGRGFNKLGVLIGKAFASSNVDSKAIKFGSELGGKIAGAISKSIPAKLFLAPLLSPLLGVAVRVLESYVSSAVALLAQMGPALAGMGLSGVAAITAIGVAVGALSLAFKTQSPLLTAFQEKMSKIGKKFEEVGKSIQKALLPKLGKNLERIANFLLPTLNARLTGTGRVLAKVSDKFAAMATRDIFKKNLGKTIGNANFLVGKMGNSLVNLISLFTTLLAAARPVIRVFGDWIDRLTGGAAAAALAGQKTGGLQRFMEKAAKTMKQWGRILGNFGKAFGNILSIGAKEGQTLANGLERLSRKFRNFTRSADNKNKIAVWFKNGIEIMRAFNRLLGAIFKAMFGNQSDTSPVVDFIDSLTKMVPAFEKLFATFNKLLPTLTRLSEAFTKFLDALVESGALDVVVKIMEAFYTILSKILSIPGMGQFAGALIGIRVAATALNFLTVGLFNKGMTKMGKSIGSAVAKSGLLKKTLGLLKGIFTTIVRVVGQLVLALGRLAVAWLVGLGPIGWIIIAVIAVIAALVLLYKKSEKFRAIVNKVFESVKKAAETAFNWIKDHWKTILVILLGPFAIAVALIIKYWDEIKAGISAAVNFIKSIVSSVFNAIKTVITTVINGIKTAIMFVFNAIKAYFTFVFNAYKTIITTVFNAIKSVITTVVNGIKMVITTAWNIIKAVTSRVWNGIKAVVSAVVNGIKAVVSRVFNALKAIVTGVWNAIKSGTTAAWNGIKSAVSKGIGLVMGVVRGLKTKVVGFFSGAGKWLLDSGKKIIGGLIDGIEAMFGKLGKIAGKVGSIIGAVIPGSPVKKGPLRVLNRGHAGKQIVKMLAEGINSNVGIAKTAAGRLSESLNVSAAGSAMASGSMSGIGLNARRNSAFQPAGGGSGTTGSTGDTVTTNNAERNLTVVNNYPKPESSDKALFKTAQKIAHLGLMD